MINLTPYSNVGFHGQTNDLTDRSVLKRTLSDADGKSSAIYGKSPDADGKSSAIYGKSPDADGKFPGIYGKKTPGKPEDPEKEKEENKLKGIKDPTQECQTCRNRKYKDGSNEMVSFKTPTHISPDSAGAAVRAHEQEHVSNAYAKAALKGGKVLRASVSIHMAVCPECGRTYISGGTTHTQIKYYNEDNPYQKELKSADRSRYSGMNLDYAV